VISPEQLRRFSFFTPFDNTQIKALAIVSEEIAFSKGDILYEIDMPADYLFVLVDGTLEHAFTLVKSQDPKIRKEFYLSDINPGEVFGLSSVIEPYKHTTTARGTSDGHVLRIQTAGLRTLGELDPRFGYNFMYQIAHAMSEKLEAARVPLDAARA